MTPNRLAAALALAGLTFAGAAQADGIRFFPALEKGFKLEPTLAITGGMTHAAGARDDSMGVYGIDFNMNCGLMQTPANRIRTHVQINRVDESGIKATSFELSPRYTLPLGAGFSVGAGPALAMVRMDNGNTDRNLFGYGAVAGLNFRAGMFYAGTDIRYLNTNERDRVQFENWTWLAKVGINF